MPELNIAEDIEEEDAPWNSVLDVYSSMPPPGSTSSGSIVSRLLLCVEFGHMWHAYVNHAL